MIPADPFDRDDFARPQGVNCRQMSGGTKLHVASKFAKLQTRSALRAGKRLGMKSAVAWIGILGRALRTEGKARHRRIGTIIRQPFDQGVARAALGAINEGVAEAPISRITHFGKAFVAGKVVRRQAEYVPRTLLH